jgi:hypothetical protein
VPSLKTIVFVSSASGDLSECRRAVTAAIDGDRYAVTVEERFGARPETPHEFCARRVARADIFICLIGFWYGARPDGEKRSFTEIEFDAACAMGARTKRLIFVAKQGFPVPGGAHEDDEQWSRLQAFRAKVTSSNQTIADEFSSCEELIRKVLRALSNLNADRDLPAADGDRGDIVPLLCDRAEQREHFVASFAANLAKPAQVYMIRGVEYENPESFAQRVCVDVEERASREFAGVPAPVKRSFAEWPKTGELWNLLNEVFTRFELPGTDFSATALARRLEPLPHRLFVVQHEIRVWRGKDQQVLQQYLDFWDAFVEVDSPQRVIVLITAIYPKAPDWRTALVTSLKRIQSARQGVNPSCRFTVLPELSCVRREDVLSWFSAHSIYRDPARRRRECDRIFGREGSAQRCVHMEVVQSELIAIHQRYQEEQA